MQQEGGGCVLSDALVTLAAVLERAGYGDPDAEPEACLPVYWLCMGGHRRRGRDRRDVESAR